MKILIATHVDLSGTTGQHISYREIIAAFARRPYINLTLICPKPLKGMPSEISINRENVKYLSPQKTVNVISWHLVSQIQMACILRNLVSVDRPNAILAFLGGSMVAPAIIAAWYKIPYYLFARGMMGQLCKPENIIEIVSHAVIKLTIRINANIAEQVYAAYEGVKELIQKFYRPSQKKIKVFYNAVDINLFKPIPLPQARQDILPSLHNDDFVVGFVGSPRPYHCLIPLIQAISLIRQTNNRIKLIIIGESSYLEVLKKFVYEQALEKFVLFTGFIPHTEVPKYISACDVLYGVIEPSALGSPIKCYEYLACARPIIVIETNEFKFVSKNNIGRAIKSVSITEIVRAIEDLYRVGKIEREAMGKRGRNYIIEKKFTWDHLVDIVLQDMKQSGIS